MIYRKLPAYTDPPLAGGWATKLFIVHMSAKSANPCIFRLFLCCVIGWLLTTGCANSRIARLRRENPFADLPRQDTSSVVIVTCQRIPLEILGEVDVSGMEFLEKYSLGTPGKQPADGIVSGFSGSQLEVWRDNGFLVAVAPISQWQEFRSKLVTTGIEEKESRTAVFKRDTGPDVFPAYDFRMSRSVFVSDAKGTLRGYTLVNGGCFFQVFCAPAPDGSTDKVYIRILPRFRGFEPTGRLLNKNFGYVNEFQDVLFDQMALDGVLKNDYFVCIAATKEPKTTGSLAEMFLKQKHGADSYQLLMVLDPKAQRAGEIKK